MDISWIKIKTNIFDDEKIMLIESLPEHDSILVIWFKILALAGKSNQNGFLMLSEKIPYTDEMLATIFRRPLNTVRLALETFKNFGMIDILDNRVMVSNWQKHQNIDGLEKVREQTRLRVQRFREKQIAQLNNNANCNATVTECNDTEKEIEREKEKERENLKSENLESDDSFFALNPKINQEYVNELFDKWSGYGFLNRGKIDFVNRFSQVLSYLKGLHSSDVFGAIDNYKQVVDSGGWYSQKHNLTFESFCKNINQFLQGNFDLRNFCDKPQLEKIEKEKAVEDNRLYEDCPCCHKKQLEWQDKKQNYYCFGCKSTMTYEDVQKMRE